LALFAITVSVAFAIVIFKYTGDRAEFRIPAMAVEIFVGMYLFRILSIGPVGFILAFIVSVSQSVVDLFPTPEEAVHQMLWVWVAVSLAAGWGWLANLVLFPVPAKLLLQREFVSHWQTVADAARQLRSDSPDAARYLLRPLVKRGPIRFQKLVKLSLVEAPSLRPKQAQLLRIVLGLDKIAKLTFSYASKLLKSPSLVTISSTEKASLGRLTERAEYFEREFAAGFIPSDTPALSPDNTVVASSGPKLAEVENTFEDLVAKGSEDERPKADPSRKKSLFVADAFSNPRHVQFALKVTLAGMIGYLFYTASDYFGIHTVYYTPLIIALASTGATMHKGLLRIVGCIIGGGLGLLCTIWLIPRFETLGMYLLIVFCLHGLAGWVAAGSDRISYMGLQIVLAFDLGVLQEYGPPKEIDPIRDRFIGIILGVLIISVVFSLVWPESAQSIVREKLTVCLRAIARLLDLGGTPQSSDSQKEQLELEIGSRLAEANSYEEQAAFEALLYGSEAAVGPNLEDATAAVEEIYVTCLPWLREQGSAALVNNSKSEQTAREISKPLTNAVEACATMMDQFGRQPVDQIPSSIDHLVKERDSGDGRAYPSDSLAELASAVREFQVLALAATEGQP
jgi:multidrug resistance protein MdtO